MSGSRYGDWERNFNWAVKLALVAMLLSGLVFPDASQFQGKAWPARVVAYPISIIVVPIIWAAAGRPGRYPHLVDGLIALPFASDIFGNVANLFDTVEYFDDFLHFLNWTFLVAAIVVVLTPLRLAAWNRVVIGSGFGAFAIIVWEIIEYWIAESGTTGLNLTYGDTISDLGLSTLGGVVGAVIAVKLRSAGVQPE